VSDVLEDKNSKYFYDNHEERYLRYNARGTWQAQTERQFSQVLADKGFRRSKRDDEMVSPAEAIMLKVRDHHDVEWHGTVAGYPPGLHEEGGFRFLVTHGPTFIEPKEGAFPMLDHIINSLLRDDVHTNQVTYLYGWLHFAIIALRQYIRRPGQALVLAGPKECGKSLLQKVITDLLGGRSARPQQAMAGDTAFNSDLFSAEHLMMEDETPRTDIIHRRNLGAAIKSITVNETQRCHKKGAPAIILRPFWRLSISLNDEPEDLLCLPPIDDAVSDKMIILRCHKVEMPMPTVTAPQRNAFWAALAKEFPAFLHFILSEFKTPAELRSERFGVTHMHHSAILGDLEHSAPEIRLLELIDAELWRSMISSWTGTSMELETLLTRNDSEVCHEVRGITRKWSGAIPAYMGRLSKSRPARVIRRRSPAHRLWEITRPTTIGDEMTEEEERRREEESNPAWATSGPDFSNEGSLTLGL